MIEMTHICRMASHNLILHIQSSISQWLFLELVAEVKAPGLEYGNTRIAFRQIYSC